MGGYSAKAAGGKHYNIIKDKGKAEIEEEKKPEPPEPKKAPPETDPPSVTEIKTEESDPAEEPKPEVESGVEEKEEAAPPPPPPPPPPEVGRRLQTIEEVLERMTCSDREDEEGGEGSDAPQGFVEIIEYEPDSAEAVDKAEDDEEMARQLSQLDVNIIHDDIFYQAQEVVAGDSVNIFHVANLDSEVSIVECIAEEVVGANDEEVEEEEVVLKESEALDFQENAAVAALDVVKAAEPSGTVVDEKQNETVAVKCELDQGGDPQPKAEEPAVEEAKAAEKPAKRPKGRPPSKGKAKKQAKAKTPVNPDAMAELEESSVRRSSRIKSISVLKKRSKGHGLVKNNKGSGGGGGNALPSKSLDSDTTSENSNSGNADAPDRAPSQDFASFVAPASSPFLDQKPVKVKSRWRRSSELEMSLSPSVSNRSSPVTPLENAPPPAQTPPQQAAAEAELNGEVEARLKQFIHLKENQYLTERLSCKEARKMVCDCFLTSDEIERGEYGCGEDCLNRLLMIECGNLCPVGERCTNKRFQKAQFAPCEVFKTDKKGLGIRAKANIPYGEFILEYVGEVLDAEEFENRAAEYSMDNNRHYYFMFLRADAVIDATSRGNISRFINHSCDPNAETQKWTVNGELRIGFFSKRTILAGEEITFDYQFQRYGKEAQKCYCESSLCRGWLGEEPDEDDDEEEEEDELDEEDVEKPDAEKPEGEAAKAEVKTESAFKDIAELPPKIRIKRERKKAVRRKIRKEIYDDLDQLDNEIDSLFTTGLKNQAQTLKLSRLMVRAKEPLQRSKLLKLLRNGEFPCRRLFLDYHGLRLIHGWMTDVQHEVAKNEKLEYLRLEILQTLATLPIPNKTMLQDTKVLPTVQNWSTPGYGKDALESDSNSPKQLETPEEPAAPEETTPTEAVKEEVAVEKASGIEEMLAEITGEAGCEEAMEVDGDVADEVKPEEVAAEGGDVKEEVAAADEGRENPESVVALAVADIKVEPELNYEDEIVALAAKLLEEWAVLKEVFRIPKKERIEQMKEHEREADRKYKAGLGLEVDGGAKKSESRYRLVQRHRAFGDAADRHRKAPKAEERNVVPMPKISKHERRKLFAMQVEHAEEERRRKQRELWKKHEQHCFMMGTDPRFTAPYDASQGYHCIWNPQTGQWQNFATPQAIAYGSFQGGVPPVMASLSPHLMHMQSASPSHQQIQIPAPGQRQVLPQTAMVHHQMNQMPPPPVPPLGQIHPTNGSHFYQKLEDKEDPSQVRFMGPIPPPAKLPPKWKCAKDKYGRPYYYHIKVRKSQWEPPKLAAEDESESSSSSETSSLSSDSSSEESDSDDDIDDSRLLQEIKNKFKARDVEGVAAVAETATIAAPLPVPVPVPVPAPATAPPEIKEVVPKPPKEEQPAAVEPVVNEGEDKDEEEEDGGEKQSSVDVRLKDIFKKDEKCEPAPKKRRAGLVEEIIISPRTEEDRLQYKEDVKRYKENKAKLKRQREIIMQQTKKQIKVKAAVQKKHKTSVKTKLKEMSSDKNCDATKKIKETFRSNMAGVMVSILNAYRKPDCKEGRITNTDDFKHLARKLTHFVMLKEMKHCANIEDLICTDSVKSKAKEFVRKYMCKFGEVYQKPKDDLEYY